MLVKDLIAQLLEYPTDASVQIYDDRNRFDFDLDHNEYSNQLDLNKFERRVLTMEETAFILAAGNATGIDKEHCIRMLTDVPPTNYDPEYTQAYDLHLVWCDAINFTKLQMETTCADTQSTTPANLPSTCFCQDTQSKV